MHDYHASPAHIPGEYKKMTLPAPDFVTSGPSTRYEYRYYTNSTAEEKHYIPKPTAEKHSPRPGNAGLLHPLAARSASNNSADPPRLAIETTPQRHQACIFASPLYPLHLPPAPRQEQVHNSHFTHIYLDLLTPGVIDMTKSHRPATTSRTSLYTSRCLDSPCLPWV